MNWLKTAFLSVALLFFINQVAQGQLSGNVRTTQGHFFGGLGAKTASYIVKELNSSDSETYKSTYSALAILLTLGYRIDYYSISYTYQFKTNYNDDKDKKAGIREHLLQNQFDYPIYGPFSLTAGLGLILWDFYPEHTKKSDSLVQGAFGASASAGVNLNIINFTSLSFAARRTIKDFETKIDGTKYKAVQSDYAIGLNYSY